MKRQIICALWVISVWAASTTDTYVYKQLEAHMQCVSCIQNTSTFYCRQSQDPNQARCCTADDANEDECLNTQAWYYFLPSIQRSVIYPMKVQQKVVKVPLVPPTERPAETSQPLPQPQPDVSGPSDAPASTDPPADGGTRRLTEAVEPTHLCSGSLKSQINKYSQFELCDQQPIQLCGDRVIAASVVEQYIFNTPLFEQPKP